MKKIDVYEFAEYRSFLRSYSEQAGNGRKKTGGLTQIAKAAGIFPSYLSQILNGRRDLNLDQAIKIADHCGLSKQGRKYFLLLVQLARAGTERLRDELNLEIRELKEKHGRLASRLPNQKELNTEEMAEFYSSWHFIAIRLYTAVSKYQTLKAISEKTGLPPKQVRRIMHFLLKTDLCVEYEPGKFRYGPAHMHLAADQPLITKHHANWRAYAMGRHALLDQSRELAYSGVFALARQDADKIRALLPRWIEQVREISDPSPSETVFCLGLDWCEV